MSTSEFKIPDKRFFRPDEVAKLLEVSLPTIYRWCDNGNIEFVRVGPRSIRIQRDCIIKIISISE